MKKLMLVTLLATGLFGYAKASDTLHTLVECYAQLEITGQTPRQIQSLFPIYEETGNMSLYAIEKNGPQSSIITVKRSFIMDRLNSDEKENPIFGMAAGDLPHISLMRFVGPTNVKKLETQGCTFTNLEITAPTK